MPDITNEQIAELRRFAKYDLKKSYGDVLARESAARARDTLALLDDYARLRRFEAAERSATPRHQEDDASDCDEHCAVLDALDAARKGGA